MLRMARFALRHWTAILIILVIAGWALFYVPGTPSYAIFELKQAIDARDGQGAARWVDFQKVVRSAGYEMVEGENSGDANSSNMLGQLVGKGAVDLFSGPMAALLQQWSIHQVDSGAKEVQMPAAAVAGAIVMLHHHENSAYTRWTDHKGQVWEVRLAREAGVWKIVEVKNVKQLLDKLQREQQKQFDNASP